MATRLRLEEAGKQAAVRTPAPGTAVKIAIDLSRTKWVYSVRWEGQEQRRLTTSGDLKHVEALVAQYPGCAVQLAFEACGFGYELAWWAAERQIGVTVIAPSRMERTPGRQVKADRLDVGTLARKLEQGTLKGIYVPSRPITSGGRWCAPTLKRSRSASGPRAGCEVCCKSTGVWAPCPAPVGRPTGSGWRCSGSRRRCSSVSTHCSPPRTTAATQAAVLKARLLRLAASEPYHKIVDALYTHPGVGPLSAIRFVLEIGDIHRCARADSIAHYLGLTPSEYSSGGSVQRGPILKCGPGALRAAMLQCGWASVRRGGEPVLQEMFERLAPRAGRKRAIVAVTRRLVVRLRARWLDALKDEEAVGA